MTPRNAWVRYANGLLTVVTLAFATMVAGNIGGTASLAQESKRLLPHSITQQMVEHGRAIFHGQGGCFRCHGENGRGTFMAPALNSDRLINLQTGSYQEITDLIRVGLARPKRCLTTMPPLGGASLTEAKSASSQHMCLS